MILHLLQQVISLPPLPNKHAYCVPAQAVIVRSAVNTGEEGLKGMIIKAGGFYNRQKLVSNSGNENQKW
jgi:hypothetical protein